MQPLTRCSLTSLLLGLLLSSCSSKDKNAVEYYKLVTPPHSVAPASKILTAGKWLVYLASEANFTPSGTDMNGDGDVIDDIAVRVDTFSDKRTELNTAVEDMAIVDGTLFLVVSETADGTDWSSDGATDDRVLLYHTPGDAQPTYLADLDPLAPLTLVGGEDRAYFVGADAPTVGGQTNLFETLVQSNGATPDLPVAIPTTIVDTPGDGISVTLLGESAEILFLGMDENLDGDLNGDLDGVDTSVLALLDGSVSGNSVLGTGLALGATTSFTAVESGTDRIVAFLVNEPAQGANLNAQALFGASWQPPACTALGDTDMLDDVLHWLLMADFTATGTIQNTGLVGTAGELIMAHPGGYVACASLEADEGLGAGCDMNGDGDSNDRIFRWIQAVDPSGAVLPETSPAMLMALVTSIPGAVGDSTGGVLVAGNLWVLLVDEAADGRDHDGDPSTDRFLVAAKNPGLVGQNWNFAHSASGVPVEATWMATDIQTSNRNLMAISEAVLGIDQNGDGDTTDSIPTFPKVLSGNTLTFPGMALAISSTNAGIVTAAGVGFFRVSEADEGATDFNNDGDTADFIVSRVGVTTIEPLVHMATLNNLDRPAVEFEAGGAAKFGVILFQESMQGATGKDVNNDGDATDYVPRYFRIDN